MADDAGTAGPVTQGRVLKSGHSSSAKRLAWSSDYRAIPSTVAAGDLLCSHISINFDRTGSQEDWNVVFPIDRLNELEAERTIGSVAATHYSFMGATDPLQMESHARELAGQLKADAVDAVILPPV